MRRLLRDNSLSLIFGLLFLAAVIGQSVAGWKEFNSHQLAEGLAQLSFRQYVSSADFAVDVSENWQSEYLQFLLYIVLTVWFLQRGSPESKVFGTEGQESAKDQKIGEHAVKGSPRWARAGGWRTAVYSWSLGITMGVIFVLSWLVQSLAGWAAFNELRLQQLQDPLTWVGYLGNADFWSRTLQNWQSEFLAVGSMAAFSVYLRQRGSPESKPVGEPHLSTGVEG